MNLKQKQFQSMCKIVDHLASSIHNSADEAILELMCKTGIGCAHPDDKGRRTSDNISPYSQSAIVKTGTHVDWECPLEIVVHSYGLYIEYREHVLEDFEKGLGYGIPDRYPNGDIQLLAYIVELYKIVRWRYTNRFEIVHSTSLGVGNVGTSNGKFINIYSKYVSNLVKKILYYRLSRGPLNDDKIEMSLDLWINTRQHLYISSFVRERNMDKYLRAYIIFQMMLETDYLTSSITRFTKTIANLDGDLYTGYKEVIQNAGSNNWVVPSVEYLVNAHERTYKELYADTKHAFVLTNPALQEHLLDLLGSEE